jgi:hypothetical protein
MTGAIGKDLEEHVLEPSTLSSDPQHFAVPRMVPNAHTVEVAAEVHGHTV